MLARDDQRAPGLGAEPGRAAQDLAPLERNHAFDPVGVRVGEEIGQAGQLRLGPGDEQRRGLDERQVEAVADTKVLVVACADAGELQAVRRRVVAGVQDRAVALARAREDVGPALEQDRARTSEREGAQHRAAHHPAADNRDLEVSAGHGLASIRSQHSLA